MEKEKKALCIVLDTNIWISNYMLKSPTASALLYSIHQNNAKIGLPEVVEKELDLHLNAKAFELRAEVEKKLTQLNNYLDEQIIPESILPSPSSAYFGIRNRFKELEPHFVRIGFTLEHAHKALEMCIRHLPPNGLKDQQFKDSAIWAAVLELSKTYEVHFITNDKGFFNGREPKNGIADNLETDVSLSKGKIEIYFGIEACHSFLKKSQVKIDPKAIAGTIQEKIDPDLMPDLNFMGLQVTQRTKSKMEYYATSKVGKLTIIFEFEYQVINKDDDTNRTRINPTAVVKGACSIDIKNSRIEIMDLETIEISWNDPSGHRVSSTQLMASTTRSLRKAQYEQTETDFALLDDNAIL